MPLLAASEKGIGQTESLSERVEEMWWKLSLRHRAEVLWNEARYRVIVPYANVL